MYTLTTLNISQLQTSIYILETAHPHTTKQLTQIYNTAHHKHATLSPHRRCKRPRYCMALVHWWPQRTTKIRCHQQLWPHNTKYQHQPECQTPHYNKHLHHISPRCLIHYTIGRHRVRFRSDHHIHQYTQCQYHFHKHLMADKHNIPKGKMHSNCRLLPEDTCDPALKLLNEEITSYIQKHKQNIWKEHLDAH